MPLLLASLVCISLLPIGAHAQAEPKQKITVYYPHTQTLKEQGWQANGQKVGIWYYYYPTGNVEHKEKWKNNQLQWQIYYTPKGKVSKTIDKKGNVKKRPACGC
jgi:antitoxin component YwqK of YwqJK toxin-antitoxin module